MSIFTQAPRRTLNRFSEEHPVNEQQLVNLVTRTATAAATAAVQKAMGGAAQQVKAEADRARAELTKFSEEKVAAEKKTAVESVIARLSGEGKLPPGEHDRARKRLLRADSRAVVEKFSENGTEKHLTEFDLAVADYEARPTCFGEKFGSPADRPASKEGAEVAKVEAHWDAFSEQFKGHTPKEELVGAFKAAQKLAPDLTAEKFLGGK